MGKLRHDVVTCRSQTAMSWQYHSYLPPLPPHCFSPGAEEERGSDTREGGCSRFSRWSFTPGRTGFLRAVHFPSSRSQPQVLFMVTQVPLPGLPLLPRICPLKSDLFFGNLGL